MTKKDYELIARVLQPYAIEYGGGEMVKAFVMAFEAENPRFNRERFLKAVYSHLPQRFWPKV